jgi:HK97 family phage major capsid protein
MDAVILEKQRLNDEANAALMEAERLSRAETLDRATRTKIDVLLAKSSSFRQRAASLKSDAELIAKFNAHAEDLGLPQITSLSTEERAREQQELRNYLSTGMFPERRAMQSDTGNLGGVTVPQGMGSRIAYALRLTDETFNPNVSNFYESENGAPLPFALVDDTNQLAVQVGESQLNAAQDVQTVDRLLLGQCPTWRSKRIYVTMELLADSAFGIDDYLGFTIGRRFALGVGQYVSQIVLNGATRATYSSNAAGATMDDVYSLLKSFDPAYVRSDRFFLAMNWKSLISLLAVKTQIGSYVEGVKRDANNRILIHGVPVILVPSLPDFGTAGGKVVVAGDFSRLLIRSVKNSQRLMRFEQTANVVEKGITGFEGYWRVQAGLLVATGQPAPFQFIQNA